MLRPRDLARLFLVTGGVVCAFGATPGQPVADTPSPAVDLPAPASSPTDDEAAPVTEESVPDQVPPADGAEDATPAAIPAPETIPDPITDPPVAGESAYQAIVVRNAFGLKTPPPPPAAPEPPAAQVTPSALKLTGIVTLLGARRATFVLQEPGKPQLNSDLVSEGEKDAMITNLEVLQIDERAGVVRVVYGGKEMALDFVNNGLKAPTAPAAPAPGTPGAVAGRVAPGVGQAGAVGIPGGFAGQSSVPAAFQPGAQSFNPAASTMLNPGNPSGLQSIPVRPTRLPLGSSTSAGYGPGTGTAQPPQPAIPPEQQALLMRAQEEISRRQGVPFPPSPPLPGIDDVGGGQGGQQPPTPVPPVPPMPGE